MEHATLAVQLLGKCLTAYGDPEKFVAAQQEFAACHCPYSPDSTFTLQKHSQVALHHECAETFTVMNTYPLTLIVFSADLSHHSLSVHV